MPNENKKVSSADWSNATTADGLQDIEDVIVAASADGVSLPICGDAYLGILTAQKTEKHN